MRNEGAAGGVSGLHPERVDHGSFASFSDADGTGWLLQERRAVPPRPGSAPGD